LRIRAAFGDTEWRASYDDARGHGRSRGQRARQKIGRGDWNLVWWRVNQVHITNENGLRAGAGLRAAAIGRLVAAQKICEPARRFAGRMHGDAVGDDRHFCRWVQQHAEFAQYQCHYYRDRNGTRQPNNDGAAHDQYPKIKSKKSAADSARLTDVAAIARI
jgi:hypothetical protein